MASGTARARRRSSRRAGHGSHSPSLAAQIRRISPAGWVALGAGVIALVLALQTLQGPSSDYDEGVYWQSLRAMADGHQLFSSVFSSQPPLFLLSVYPFYTIFGQSLSAARIALILFSLAGIAGTYVAGRALGHPAIGAVACLLLALDPLYEHGAHTLQAELPSVAVQIWAVACAILAMRASGRRRTWLAVGSGVLLGCALLIKLFAIVALVPIVLYLSVPLARRWLDRGGHLRWPTHPDLRDGLRQIAPALGWLVAGLIGAIIVVLLPYIGQLGAVYDQVVRFHLAAAQTDSHTLRDNLHLIGTTLWDARLVVIAVPAMVVVVWRRMWVSAPLIL
ncbi:MAG TPA: glycosyltransferase family 39 protein, partial [Ktedonobacterales bacterium]|nr:glycosyltransferase family 39 protein [Ktedonobacterales bacterium]